MGSLPMFWVKNLKSREGTWWAPLFDFLAVPLTLLLWTLLSLASGVSLLTHLEEVSGPGQSQGLLPPERPHYGVYVSRPQHLPPISPKKGRGLSSPTALFLVHWTPRWTQMQSSSPIRAVGTY